MFIKEMDRIADNFGEIYEITFDFHSGDFKENEIHDLIQNKNVDLHFTNIFFRQLDIKDKTKLILELQKQVFEEI